MDPKKNTTIAPKKTAAAKPVEKPVEKKSDASVKTYATFGALLSAKSKKALPYGTKASVGVDHIIISAKGTCIAKLSIRDFANNELKRHGFQLSA